VAPDDMVPGIWPPLPIDPPIRAMAGPATDPATRQAIAAARRGIDLFMVKSFLGSPGNTFPYYQELWIDSQRCLRPIATPCSILSPCLVSTGQADG
jgi:hypothetical protein